ncbi:TolC family protein [Albibacterium indicum]|uniref:TolC family protein n=1 Tax=Albibacterium indicum TaxID=2292082 RepID=UPI00198116B0|nr:TolC family protein [Pedobacter indicus]
MKMNKLNRYVVVAVLMWLSIFSKASAQNTFTDSLSYYIQVAIENNPGLKSQKYIHAAFLEKIPQAGAYQDPELSMEAYTMPMEVVGGRSIGNISLMQVFPWFGTRKAARTEATHMANVQDKQYQEVLNSLILQVSTKWYLLQKLSEQLKNNQENKVLLEQLEQLAIRKFSAPSGGSEASMSETLRIQMGVAEIENNIESLHAQIEAEKAEFNALLNRKASEEVMVGKEIRKLNFLYSEKEALRIIQMNNPVLGMITEEGLAYKAKAEADRKMSYPMIGIGVEYMVLGKTNNAMLAMDGMNGNDMVMPMVSLSLPLFRKKYNAQQNESRLWRKSSEESFKNTLNTLESEFYSFKSQLDDAERTIELYEKQTTLAQTTYNLIVKEFISGKSDLTNVIEVQRQLLDYQLKRAEALTNYNTLVVSIKKLLADNR